MRKVFSFVLGLVVLGGCVIKTVDGNDGSDGKNGKDGTSSAGPGASPSLPNSPGASGGPGVGAGDGVDPSKLPELPLSAGTGSKRMIGYFTAWSVYDRGYFVTDVPSSALTHLNHGFANVTPDGECALGDPFGETQKLFPGDTQEAGALRGIFHQYELLKQKNTKLKTLISVGGWTWSAGFPVIASTAAGRTKLATSCVAFMKKYGFDGIDLDWEYPVMGGLQPGKPEDTQNYTLLLAEFRAQLDAVGGGLLTIAAPAAPKVAANIEIEKVAKLVDWLDLMAYDFHGSWDKTTGLQSGLFARPNDPLSVDVAVRTYYAAKVPVDKLVVGMPFYGRGFSGVGAVANGLDQPFDGVPKGTWEAGVFDFEDLAKTKLTTMTRRFDPVAKVPFLYDATSKVFITYEDPESLGLKAQYVHDHGLGGAMFWELSADDANASLVNAVQAKL